MKHGWSDPYYVLELARKLMNELEGLGDDDFNEMCEDNSDFYDELEYFIRSNSYRMEGM